MFSVTIHLFLSPAYRFRSSLRESWKWLRCWSEELVFAVMVELIFWVFVSYVALGFFCHKWKSEEK